MSNAIASQQTKLEVETASAGVYQEILEINSYSGFDGQASEIDVTHMKSTAKEFRLGLQDFGQFSMDVNVIHTDLGQQRIRTIQASGAAANFRVTYPNGDTATFLGLVKSFSEQSGVDGVVKGTITIRISGAVTLA